MGLIPGTRIGPYEISAQIGIGGMGEVYRATDTNLGRQVAIKVLPDMVAQDSERLARFDREARTLATLNHPGIAQIYGVEKQGARTALVMELVEGPTLADRIAGGPIPLDETLSIAKQIAEALEAAHEQGIIHRDLKPANIKVRSDGTVKVLDFGLAKAMEPVAGTSSSVSMAPTITTPAMTQMGMILGTAAYMSPEQARGKPVDKRTDIWAFGCVLYEMLTGRRAFKGESLQDVLANLLTAEPDWRAFPAGLPVVRALVAGCLEKDPRARVSGAAAARFALGTLQSIRLDDSSPGGRSSFGRVVAGVVALLLILMAGAVGWSRFAGQPLAPTTRTSIAGPGVAGLAVGGFDRDLAIAGSGRQVVYRGSNQFFRRDLAQLSASPLISGSPLQGPFVSPDGNWVGFFLADELKKVPMAGGPPITVTRLEGFSRGATWGENDDIVFATNTSGSGLRRVSAEGGVPAILTVPDAARGERDHMWPQFLPGAQALLFTIVSVTGELEDAQVAVLDLSSGQYQVVLRGAHDARYVPTGHLVYGSGGAIWAIPFDLSTLAVTGSSALLVDGVMTTTNGGVDMAIGSDGTLVYVPGGAVGRVLVWVDRTGREELVGVEERAYQFVRISPDGKRVAVDIRDQQNDIFVFDVANPMALRRLTFDAAADQCPVWGLDGRQIYFMSTRDGMGNTYRLSVDGSGAPVRLTNSPNPQCPLSMSPSGDALILREVTPETGNDLRWLPIEAGGSDSVRESEALVVSPFVEVNGEVSPDGRWLAYQSNESGEVQVFVKRFPEVGSGYWQVSSVSGREPRWSATGNELFYRSADGAVMAVHVRADADWRNDPPEVIVPAGRYLVSGGATGRTFEVAPDGRFLMIRESGQGQAASDQVVVVQNWFAELRRLAPAD